jgi:hypothetical protein
VCYIYIYEEECWINIRVYPYGIAVVMAILGVLIVADSPALHIRESRDIKRRHLRQISLAMETYYNDFEHIHFLIHLHQIKGCGTAGITACEWGSPWKKTPASGAATVYMIALPDDPATSRSYYYDSDGTYYKLYASLENDKDEGAGVNLTGYGSLTQRNDTCRTAYPVRM